MPAENGLLLITRVGIGASVPRPSLICEGWAAPGAAEEEEEEEPPHVTRNGGGMNRRLSAPPPIFPSQGAIREM